jgi:hypothetical protein
MNFQAQTDG